MQAYINRKPVRLYKIWDRMRGRCNNPRDSQYRNYGARGIKIEWKSFNEFAADMNTSFEEHSALHGGRDTTLDRADNNSNYSKENCRWATWKEQSNNTRRSVWITHNGMTKNAAQWAEYLGMSRDTMYARLRAGWDTDRILTTPARKILTTHQ